MPEKKSKPFQKEAGSSSNFQPSIFSCEKFKFDQLGSIVTWG